MARPNRLRRGFLALLVGLGVVNGPAGAASAVAPGPTPAQLRPALVGDSEQLVVVSTSSWSQTTATVELWQRGSSGWTKVNDASFTARIGRNGFSANHVEGDGTSPAGSFPLVSAFGLSNTAGTKLAYTRLRNGHCWISDVTRADYNRMVIKRPCGSKNEDLYRIAAAGAYQRAIVSGYNMNPVVSGAGSAIFVHLHSYTRAGRTKPTSGCVSLTRMDMNTLWRWVDPSRRPRIVMGPAAWLEA